MKKNILILLMIVVLSLLSKTIFAQVPSWQWAKSAGGASDDIGQNVASDGNGNVYVTGRFLSSTISFGSHTLTKAGAGDFFLVKYDKFGNVLWATSAGGYGQDAGMGVTIDANGNIYIIGTYYSPTISFGNDTLTNQGASNIFLVKYTNNGNVIWAKSAGNNSIDGGISIAAEQSGNIYVTGYFYSYKIIFGNDTLINNGSSDYFIVKYDTSGSVLWAKSAGGEGYDAGNIVTTDVNGHVYVVGYFESSTMTFGSNIFSNGGLGDMFLVKYDGAGNLLWAKSAGGSDRDNGYCVNTNKKGDVYVTGFFKSTTITYGNTTLMNAGGCDIFLVKYDVLGNAIWAKSTGGSDLDAGTSVATDTSGNIFISGNFKSPSIVFGNYTLTNSNAGYEDFFLVKYNEFGNVLWAKRAGGNDVEYWSNISITISGDVYIAGCFLSPSITFGSYTLYNAGNYDMFLAKSDGAVDINELQLVSNNIKISPNPAKSILCVQSLQNAEIEILNLEGQIIKRINTTEKQTTIDISDFARGMYFIKVTTEKEIITRKFIKE